MKARSRRIMVAAAAVALATVAWLVGMTWSAQTPGTGLQREKSAVDRQPPPPAGGNMVRIDPGPDVGIREAPMPLELPPVDSEDYRSALARAFAFAGAEADGYGDFRGELDDLAKALLPQARRLLADSQASLRRGPGLPSQTGMGTMSVLVPDKLAAQAAQAPAFGAGPEAIPAERVAATLAATTVNDMGGKVYLRTKPGPVMVQAGQWADIDLYPQAYGLSGMVIGNQSPGEYVIKIDAPNFSPVRLNGAMVVPGRFYRVTNGSVHVMSGPVKARVTIRPLGAVPVYAEMPTAFPSSAG